MTTIASTRPDAFQDRRAPPAGQPAPTFTQLQTQGQARPPRPMPQTGGQPDISGAWQQMYTGAQQPQFQGGPQSNVKPGGYQGPGNFSGYKPSTFAQPKVQQQGQFTAPQQGQQVDQRTMQAVMQALGNPSRYGAKEAGDTFDVLNRRLTQAGTADYGRINEDMARRGIHASTTAGGRLGDLATNLNQQRADYATNIATDQARNYQTDRASAIAQAMGYGGQQFEQGIQGFGANQNAGQQRFLQEQAAGEFGLDQNAQNFSQGADQHRINQDEARTRFDAGMRGSDFSLRQNNQNFNQGADRFQLNQGANQQGFGQMMAALQGLQGFGQQGFRNQMETAGFNADNDYRNTQLWLSMLGQT